MRHGLKALEPRIRGTIEQERNRAACVLPSADLTAAYLAQANLFENNPKIQGPLFTADEIYKINAHSIVITAIALLNELYGENIRELEFLASSSPRTSQTIQAIFGENEEQNPVQIETIENTYLPGNSEEQKEFMRILEDCKKYTTPITLRYFIKQGFGKILYKICSSL